MHTAVICGQNGQGVNPLVPATNARKDWRSHWESHVLAESDYRWALTLQLSGAILLILIKNDAGNYRVIKRADPKRPTCLPFPFHTSGEWRLRERPDNNCGGHGAKQRLSWKMEPRQAAENTCSVDGPARSERWRPRGIQSLGGAMRDARKDEGLEAPTWLPWPGLRPPALPKAAPCQALCGALGTLGWLRFDAGHKDSNPGECAVGASPRPPPPGWGSTSPQLSVLAANTHLHPSTLTNLGQ